MKNLVIVESPSKSKTIEKYLGKDFTVTSSKGHICDLATRGKEGLGVDIDPVVEHGEELLSAEQLDEVAALIALEQDLRGVEALQQLVDVLVVALGQIELARRYVEEGHP